MIRIFGFNISTEDQAIVDKIRAILPKDYECDSIDLRCYEPAGSSQDILLIFGEKAAKICNDLPCKFREIFPDFPKLSPDFGEPEEIEQARAKFKLLQQRLAEPDKVFPKENTVQEDRSTYTEESLPDTSAAQILQQLQTILQKKGQKEWLLYTKNNKSVRVTIEPEQSNADIDITFAELYTLKMAMETLQAKELEIVYRSNTSREKHTS